MITEKTIKTALLEYEEYYSEIIKEKNAIVYVNKEQTPHGETVSAYIGLEDVDGRAITGYDENI